VTSGHFVVANPLRKPRRLAISAAAALLTASMLAACSDEGSSLAEENGEPDKVTYLTSFGQLGRDAYAYVAQDLGFFEEAGIEVTIEPGSGMGGNTSALLGGQADFIVSDLGAVTVARSGGELEGLVAFAAIHQLPPVAIMTNHPDVRTPVDLENRTVAIAPGTVTELLFPTWLELAGADPSTVTVEPVNPPDLVSSLASGQVDAIEQFAMGEPLVAANVDGEVQVLPYSDYLTDLYGVVLLTTNELAESDPDLCIRFRDALLRGLEYALENPDEAGQILADNVPEANPEVAARELELMRAYAIPSAGPLGTIDADKIARSVALLQSVGAIGVDTALEPEDLVDFSLVPTEGGES
jgi:NitT/TauT family transport system substrate-binding protein